MLGTSFNLSSYSEEAQSKTTLISGALEVVSIHPNGLISLPTRLKPGYQAVVNKNGDVSTFKVDTTQATAWKNGIFSFKNERLDIVMSKIARWYDIEFEFTDPKLAAREIGGTMSRSDEIEDILKILKLTGLANFKIEGRKIMISN